MNSATSITLVVVLGVGLFCTAVQCAAEPYESLSGRKAMALASDPVLDAEGVSHGQPSDVTAAMAALTACAQRRAQLGVTNPCEVVRLNGERIQTGAQIRERLPRENHPLFLWQVNGKKEATVYLAGSVHALKATLYPLPPPFEAAFQRSDTLVVEVDTVSSELEGLQRSMLEYTLLPTGATLDEVIAPATLRALNRYLAEQTIPPASVAMLKPVMIATQLSVMRLMALGYLPDQGLEHHFINRRGDRAVIELETIDQQLEVLTSPAMALQEELLLDTLLQMPEMEATVAALIVAWLAGDDIELRRLFDEQTGQSAAYQAFMEQLLGKRNRAMANRIGGFLDGQQTYFVLVGAAHLTGSDGIVALLEAQGYRVRRIGSEETL
jgi:uncharacterized protein YbaP (TraB family)